MSIFLALLDCRKTKREGKDGGWVGRLRPKRKKKKKEKKKKNKGGEKRKKPYNI